MRVHVVLVGAAMTKTAIKSSCLEHKNTRSGTVPLSCRHDNTRKIGRSQQHHILNCWRSVVVVGKNCCCVQQCIIEIFSKAGRLSQIILGDAAILEVKLNVGEVQQA